MMKTHKSSFLPFHVCGVSFDAEKSISVKQLFFIAKWTQPESVCDEEREAE